MQEPCNWSCHVYPPAPCPPFSPLSIWEPRDPINTQVRSWPHLTHHSPVAAPCLEWPAHPSVTSLLQPPILLALCLSQSGLLAVPPACLSWCFFKALQLLSLCRTSSPPDIQMAGFCFSVRSVLRSHICSEVIPSILSKISHLPRSMFPFPTLFFLYLSYQHTIYILHDEGTYYLFFPLLPSPAKYSPGL